MRFFLLVRFMETPVIVSEAVVRNCDSLTMNSLNISTDPFRLPSKTNVYHLISS